MSDEKEISRIREEETQRGRRPQHLSEKEKRDRLKMMMRDALHRGNRGLFEQVLIALDLKPGSDAYEACLKKYEDCQRGKR
jgi:hypothetical protein